LVSLPFQIGVTPITAENVVIELAAGPSRLTLGQAREPAMFKASVIAFTIFICGAMLTIAHYDAHFAQLPKPVLAKRAA
jgi:hypothetical protein